MPTAEIGVLDLFGFSVHVQTLDPPPPTISVPIRSEQAEVVSALAKLRPVADAGALHMVFRRDLSHMGYPLLYRFSHITNGKSEENDDAER